MHKHQPPHADLSACGGVLPFGDRMKKILKLFNSGNVCVFGLRGRGKDLLMSNVVARRGLPYVCNSNYGGDHIPLIMKEFDCGGNTYDNFLNNKIIPYVYPYSDGVDIYISDAGVYFPSQYCGDLNKKYGYFSTFMALSRHLGDCNVHFNVQNLNRVWDKIREQSDIYICCNWSRFFFKKWVLQKITIYEKYESAVSRVPPYRAPRIKMNEDRRLQVAMAKQNYRISHGEIKSRIIFYKHLSGYDTRVFKDMLSPPILEDYTAPELES